MHNLFSDFPHPESWTYHPPTYQCNSKYWEEACPSVMGEVCKNDCEDYRLKTYLVSPQVQSPEGKIFSLDDLNQGLERLEFGNKKQIEFLAALNYMREAEEKGITDKTKFHIN